MNKILVGGFVVGMLETNCWVLHREGEQKAVVVDPGDAGEALAEAIARQGLQIAAIVLTHAHFDHIGGVREIKKAASAPLYLCERENRLDHDPGLNLSAMYHRPATVQPDVWLRDGEEVSIAGMRVRCIWTPGHTEGSCCYYLEETGEEESGAACPPILLSGDTLFRCSVGRTDFPTGSEEALARSIREKLYTLREETRVFPGHGDVTSIGYEKQHNYVVPAI